MAQNQDPFSLQFGPMIPAGSVTSQPDEVAPPLPPRPKRRPVHAARAATSQLPRDPGPPTSPTQNTQFGELGTSPTNPLPSLTPPNFNAPAPGYGSIPPAMTAQVAASPGSPESKPKKRHSFFSSAVRQFAKVTFLESITPGLSAALAFDNPAMPDPHQSAPFPESQVVVNGVKLGQADLLALQAVVGPVLPGSYWYDRVSGAYGMAGGPCSGFLSANLPLGGGQLASDASGHTGTGVFINGREIHTIDVVGLQRMGAVVMPGRWWLNADGSYGAEGSFVVLGNLRLQANAANNAGGAHSWSTSMGHYGGSDGQGFSYVGGPGWSYSSG